jgi:hypothetical protein
MHETLEDEWIKGGRCLPDRRDIDESRGIKMQIFGGKYRTPKSPLEMWRCILQAFYHGKTTSATVLSIQVVFPAIA